MALEDISEVLDTMTGALLNGKALRNIAKIYRKLYLDLQQEGFTKEEALKIIINYQISGRS